MLREDLMNLSIFGSPKSYIFCFLYNCSIINFYKRSVEMALLKENMPRIRHSILGFSVGAISSYLLLSSPYISDESALMLLIFNLLFVSLIFPLNGTLTTKTCMLLVGNVIGFFWSNLFSLFAHVATYYFGAIFSALYIILDPLINFVWIVSFWSISLSVLANSEKRKSEAEP
jgi:hypothetical protein